MVFFFVYFYFDMLVYFEEFRCSWILVFERFAILCIFKGVRFRGREKLREFSCVLFFVVFFSWWSEGVVLMYLDIMYRLDLVIWWFYYFENFGFYERVIIFGLIERNIFEFFEVVFLFYFRLGNLGYFLFLIV